MESRRSMAAPEPAYRLDDQFGFILRKAHQRHLAIFAAHMPDLTPRQFAALAKLCEVGSMSQNELGRQTAMDAATIKGVIDRLKKQELVATSADTGDRRRLLVRPSRRGALTYRQVVVAAQQITAETLAPLGKQEQRSLLALLRRLV